MNGKRAGDGALGSSGRGEAGLAGGLAAAAAPLATARRRSHLPGVHLAPRLVKAARDLAGGLWFLPAVISAACVSLAVALPWAERTGALGRWLEEAAIVRLFDSAPEGARILLTSGAGALATILGVAFSLTLVTLQLAAAQYGPRVLASFLRDRVTRLALGAFLGTIAYLLLLVPWIRSRTDREPFVPASSIALGVALILACLWILAFFLHHLAHSIQAATVIAAIGKDTIGELRRVSDAEPDGPAPDREAPGTHVLAAAPGYVQIVDAERLLSAAPRGCRCVTALAAAGDFVLPGMRLVLVQPPVSTTQRDDARIRAAFAFGSRRSTTQDALFGVRQLADMALRALSPGVNDVTTAQMVVNELGAIAAVLVAEGGGRGGPYRRVASRGVVAFVPRLQLGAVLDHAFAEIPDAAAGHPRVLVRLMEVLEHLAGLAGDPAHRAAIARVAARVGQSVAAARGVDWERERLRERWIALRRATTDHASDGAGAEPAS